MPGHGVCAEEQRGGNAPFALEQMACRKPFNVNRGLKGKKGKREGEFTTGCSGLQLKRKTCLVVLRKHSHNAPVRRAAEGKRVP